MLETRPYKDEISFLEEKFKEREKESICCME